MSTTRFDELLPFYVNGTLAEADRAWVEDWLREHPAARAELHWARSLQARLHEDVPAVSSEVGLERALARIRRDGPAPQRARRAAPPSLLARLGDWVGALVPQPVLRPAFAAAVALAVVQGAALLLVLGERADDTSEIRAVPPAAVAEAGPYLKLNFRPDAREADIRMLLVEVHGDLAAGPGQLGDYYVRVADAQQLAAVSSKLSASGIVD
ncbi:MAG TPA: hypothetical protein VFZ93_00225, partial [Albitalea sp.]